MTIQIVRHWRLNAQRYGLVGNVCPDCTSKIFPPREVCPHCAEKTEMPFQFNGQGETYSYYYLDFCQKSIKTRE